MSLRRSLFVVSLVLLWSGSAVALTTAEVKITCPLDGHAFTYQAMMSGTQFGQRLDLKPIGPIAAPAPLPVCPKDQAVVFDEDLTGAPLAKQKALVATAAYKAAAKDEPSYALLARTLEALGHAPAEVGFAWLRASWQVEGDAAKVTRFLTAALSGYEKGMVGKAGVEAFQMGLIAGELERRLGRFEAAGKRFAALAGHDTAKERPFAGIIAYQQKLVAAKDAAPHQIPKEAFGE